MRAFLERHSKVIAWAVAPHKEEADIAWAALEREKKVASEALDLSFTERYELLARAREDHQKEMDAVREENARLLRTNRLLVERLQGQGQRAEQWPAEACGNCAAPVAETMDKHVMGTVTDRRGKYLLYCDGSEEKIDEAG